MTKTLVRKDIQALRAVAIGAVVLNHLWPDQVSGGYVGVDVFFVISGFLISSHLLKELGSTGKLRLGAFYARRVMRLLPAAFLVIATSAIATWRYLPYDQWTENAKEFVASTLYYENWVLAARSINYSAQGQAETVIRHYWSLSVEEQFYLVWPLILLTIAWIGSRRAIGKRRKVEGPLGIQVAVLGAIAVGFFVVSVVVTAHSPDQAYFITPTRMWEFAIGGLVAVVAPRIQVPHLVAEILSLAGLAGIVYTCLAYSATTPFPGSAAAVPTLCTAVVILAGTDYPRLLHGTVSGLPPVQFIGDVSYSLYLWHWPLVVILPYALNHTLSWQDKVAIMVASALLAWVTKVLVEDPGRRLAWPRARSQHAFGLMGVGILVTGALSLGLIPLANAKISENDRAAQLAAKARCAGPRALHDQTCGNPFTTAVSNPVMTDVNKYWRLPPECRSDPALTLTSNAVGMRCDYSYGNSHAPQVWLVGDSHAEEWQLTVLPIAKQQGWNLSIVLLGGCPPADAPYLGYGPGVHDPAGVSACTTWNGNLIAAVNKARPDLILTAAETRAEYLNDGTGRPQFDQMVSALKRTWQGWKPSGARVVVIADTPLNYEVRNLGCIEQHASQPMQCAVARVKAQPADPLVVAARSFPGVGLIDLTNEFCDLHQCYAAVGGMAVYYDTTHINALYAAMLPPYFAEQLIKVAPGFVHQGEDPTSVGPRTQP